MCLKNITQNIFYYKKYFTSEIGFKKSFYLYTSEGSDQNFFKSCFLGLKYLLLEFDLKMFYKGDRDKNILPIEFGIKKVLFI